MLTVARKLSETGTLSLHDEMMRRLPNQSPTWLVSGSLLEDQWEIATDDPRKKAGAVKRLMHHVVIARSGGRLTDPDREHDRITSKMMAYYLLEPPNAASAISATSRVSSLHWLMRWRNDAGFFRMADLNGEETFRTWAERLCFGQRETVDWSTRVTAFLHDLAGGRIILPTRRDNDGKSVVSRTGIAALLGVSSLGGLPERHFLAILTVLVEMGLENGGATTLLSRLKVNAREQPSNIPTDNLAWNLQTWADLWAVRGMASHDPIGYNPFVTQSPFKRAKEFVRIDAGRTRTAPEYQACFLIDRALRWVFEFSEPILTIVDRLANLPVTRTHSGRIDENTRQAIRDVLADFDVVGLGFPSKVRTDAIYRVGAAARVQSGLTIHDVAFDLLPTACAIVVATFTARRKQEISSLRCGCIEYDADGEPWMLTWIEKTLRDIDRIPIPTSVVKAVEILDRLSVRARKRNGTEWLFDRIGVINDTPVYTDLGRAIKRFADCIEVPPLPDGSEWEFSPHQFRRFFSIVYYHRFHYASLTALSEFLRHYDPDMTRRYITEATRGALGRIREEATAATEQIKQLKAAAAPTAEVASAQSLLDELAAADKTLRLHQKEFDGGRLAAEFSRMWSVAVGEEMIGGHQGEMLKSELEKLIAEARRKVELSSQGGSDEASVFNGLLSKFVRSRTFEPHPQGHSYCGCTRTRADLAVAGCLRRRKEDIVDTAGLAGNVGRVPDFAFADPFTCSACPHNIQMQENRDWWERQLQNYLGQAQRPVTEHFGLTARTMADKCASHVRRCFDDARPMSIILGDTVDG